MRKNVAAQYVSFQMIAVADGSDVTSGTPAVYYTIDGGTQATGGGTATHEGNGQWSYLVVQAETNGDHVAWTMVLATAVSQTVNTYPVSFDPTDAVRIGLTSLPNAAADAAGGLAISDAGGLDLDTQLAATNEVTAVRMGALTDWINGGRLDLLLDAIPTTAMRGTDSAALASEVTSARMGALTDWIDGGRLDLLLDAIPTTAMRGTDSAALAAVLGAAAGADIAADVAAVKAETALIVADTNELQTDDVPTLIAAVETKVDTVDTVVDGILTDTAEIGVAGAGLTVLATQASVNTVDSNVDAILVDTGTTLPATLATIEADTGELQTDWANTGRLDTILDTAASGGSAPTAAAIRTEIDSNSTQLAAIVEDTGTTIPGTITTLQATADAIPTTAMRGTDSAALASVATEARLAELDAANLPTDIAAIPTTAMRGTDSAALASVATEARLAELDAGNLPTDIAAIPTTAMRGTDLAATATALSTVSTTIGAAGAGLTEAGGTGDHLTALPWNAAWDAEVESEVNDAIDTAISELGVGAPTATPTIRTGMMLMYMALRNKTVTQTSGTDALEVYNDDGTIIAKKLLTDVGGDYTAAEMTSG